MKRIVLLTTAASLLAPAFCFAQKPAEPAVAPPIAGLAPGAAEGPAAPTTRPSRKPSSSSSAVVAGTFFTTGSRGDSIPPVMIRFSAADAKASAALEEDIFVMARVISRTLERADRDSESTAGDRVNYRLGVPMLLTGSGRSVRPMYIEGLGPLFMIKVNFALLPAAKADEKSKKAPAADTEWDTAHREVFGQTEIVIADEPPGRTSSYKEEQVEFLKKELIGALKNAANIRGLKADEFVTIAVFGHAPARGRSSGNYSKRGGSETNSDDAGVDKGSVMTLRARKSDIDGFANGKLDADAFRAKVTLTAYAGSGTGVTSINSWIQESAGRLQLR